MNILSSTPAQRAAQEVQQLTAGMIGFNRAGLNRIYELVNTPGIEQEILDEFGENGAAALGTYVAFQQAMEQAEPGSVPGANKEVFVPQPDGSLLYVPLPETE